MQYFVCAGVSVFFIYYLEHNGCKLQKRGISFTTNSIPSDRSILSFAFGFLLIYWMLLIGLQYNTGTDYYSYIKIFSSLQEAEVYRVKKEYLFYYLAVLLINKNVNPQFGLVIIALIQFSLFFWFLKNIQLKHYSFFLFLYFFVSTSFYNQTNGIRQFSAVYFFLTAVWFLYKRRFVYYFLFIILGGLFHRSAYFLLPLYFVNRLFSKTKFYYALLFGSFFISIFGIDFILTIIAESTKIYSHYLTNDYGTKNIPIINKITKYVFIPFYMVSILSRRRLTGKKDIFFYNLGFISFCIRIAFLSSYALNRFAYYFEILSIFPLYYLLIYLFKENGLYKSDRLFIISLFFILSISLFCIKIFVFPSGEYAYKSIFSHYF
jgi:hypothetical protein